MALTHSPVLQQTFPAPHDVESPEPAPVLTVVVITLAPPPPPAVGWHFPQAPTATTLLVFDALAVVPQNGAIAESHEVLRAALHWKIFNKNSHRISIEHVIREVTFHNNP